MFSVTNVNLTADARHGDAGAGPRRAVQMSADELVALLEVFAEIDAHENNAADAEIRVESRRNRFIVRTAQKKLFLHNPRDLAEPAYVLSAREIIAELDGSAAEARRTAPPLPLPLVTDRGPSSGAPGTPSGDGEFLNELPARPPPEPPSFPFVLVALVVALGGYVIYAEFFAPHGDPRPALTPLSATELVAEESALTGSYMTGTEPGQHGIVILAGGKLELFQVNARGGPGTVYATYTLGRKNGELALSTDQPGGLIKVSSRDALEFCGETYKRIRAR
jgi:hypothetical protein